MSTGRQAVWCDNFPLKNRKNSFVWPYISIWQWLWSYGDSQGPQRRQSIIIIIGTYFFYTDPEIGDQCAESYVFLLNVLFNTLLLEYPLLHGTCCYTNNHIVEFKNNINSENLKNTNSDLRYKLLDTSIGRLLFWADQWFVFQFILKPVS